MKPTLIQPQPYFFSDTVQFPNSRLPVLLYTGVMPSTYEQLDDWFEKLLTANNWKGVWRNGILPYHHYHSTSHEVLCIYAGWVDVLVGGPNGQTLRLQTGDVVVIPAGVAHKNAGASENYAVLGAYPEGLTWDLLTGEPGERPAVDKRISQLPLPTNDPLYGLTGQLVTLWQEQKGAV